MNSQQRITAPTSNYTSMLIQAQESKHLVQRLINLKPSIDNRKPKEFVHI